MFSAVKTEANLKILQFAGWLLLVNVSVNSNIVLCKQWHISLLTEEGLGTRQANKHQKL